MALARWATVAVASGLAGCTLFVNQSTGEEGAPCEGLSDCLAGYACEDSVCVAITPASQHAGDFIGSAGGRVMGPDGTELVIPAGAMPSAKSISIERRSASFAIPQRDVFVAYAILPEDLELDAAATFRIPITADLCSEGGLCELMHEAAGAWGALATQIEAGDRGSVVSAELLQFGVVAVTYPLGATRDAGPADASADHTGQDLLGRDRTGGDGARDAARRDLEGADLTGVDMAWDATRDGGGLDHTYCYTVDGGCPDDLHCEESTGQCVACYQDDHCPEGWMCDLYHTCVDPRCQGPEDCQPFERCDSAIERCVENRCQRDEQCSFALGWLCDLLHHVCVYAPCNEDSDCDLESGERCDLSRNICKILIDGGN